MVNVMIDKLENILFLVVLLAFVSLCAMMVASSSGPIVLGTELNTNGYIEYLCLGNGCNKL